MKTRITFVPFKITILTLCIGLYMGCSNLSQDDLILESEVSQSSTPWYELIEQFDSPSGIIVTEGNSIQEAINVSNSGDVIYIEPGVYSEHISLKPGIKLFGLNNDLYESVVLKNSGLTSTKDIPAGIEINNIQFKGAEGNTFKTSAKKEGEKSNQKFITMTREELGDVAHYTFDVRLGHGKYERVTLHRLVLESMPFGPVQTEGNIFMVHGASQNFEDIYLIAGEPNVSSNSSVAMYLASNGMDVWGIDLGWTRVPNEETDFSFMKDWGVDREVDDILKGMAIARVIRGITKQGFGRMNLLGFSYSVGLTYVAAGRETQEHWVKRDIKGIIPVDGLLKNDPTDTMAIALNCANAQNNKEQLDSGIYNNKSGISIFGQLAAASPDDPSPILPWLTNFQAALFIGTNTYNLGGFPNDHWHFVAGVYDNGIPVDLVYSSPERWIKLLGQPHAGPYMPIKSGYEFNVCNCNPEDSNLDDHLSEIKVPTLYIASGGVGTQPYYTVDQLGSQDVTKHLVSLNADPKLDFGHGDLFIANNADIEVWEVIRQWLLGHN